MKHFTYILFFGFLINIDSYSCSCDSTNVFESFEHSDYIFIGQIIKSEFFDYQDSLFDQMYHETDYKYTFRIDELFKGDSIPEIDVMTYYGSSCHFPLVHGEYYLIYSYNWRGYQKTGMCTRTKSTQDDKFSYDYKILRELREKNINNQYRTGLYQSADKKSYFKFYNSGRFYFRTKDKTVKHGAGKYLFTHDSLIINFTGQVENKTKENYQIYPDTLDSINLEITTTDFDLEIPLKDYALKITDKSDSIVFRKKINKSNVTIKLDKNLKLDSLYFSKPEYPDFKTDFCEWESRDLHVLEINWQEDFEIIEKQKVICKLHDDKITSFTIENKDEGKNTGYNTQYSKKR